MNNNLRIVICRGADASPPSKKQYAVCVENTDIAAGTYKPLWHTNDWDEAKGQARFNAEDFFSGLTIAYVNLEEQQIEPVLGLRAFRGTFLVAIDENESPELEAGDETEPVPVTLVTLKEWLKKAIILDVNTEEEGDPHGFQSCELKFDSLYELPQSEVKRLYGK
jgi:hypothetical protein